MQTGSGAEDTLSYEKEDSRQDLEGEGMETSTWITSTKPN
jgi:hypothetical protein